MKILDVITCLEKFAPTSLQESYDNAGLITGDAAWPCTGVVVCLDSTEEVIEEAVRAGANLVIAHHPIIFSGLKKINGKNYVEKAIIKAIKNDLAIYAMHTNLDNLLHGVNKMMADRLGLINRQILQPKQEQLCKLQVFVPVTHAGQLKDALFAVGAGSIGNYSECSFSTDGTGSFKASEGTNPYVGNIGERHLEKEQKVEVIFAAWQTRSVLAAMRSAHPYEEIAYDLLGLKNEHPGLGSGLIGELPSALTGLQFLNLLKKEFLLSVVRHTAMPAKEVKIVAVCGGAGSWMGAWFIIYRLYRPAI